MSIEGRLSDYSFLNIIAILAESKESGRLQIDYKWGQGLFYFDKGELASAQVGSLIGFSAVNVALSIEGTCSRFDSHCEPISTQFSETNERLLLNRLLGMQVVASRAANSLSVSKKLIPVPLAIPEPMFAPVMGVPKTVTPSPAPRTIAIPAKPESPRSHADVPESFLANRITQSTIYEQRRTLIFRAASILLLGFVAAAGITVFRSKADTPASRPLPPQTAAKVNPEASSVAFNSRIEDNGGLDSSSTDPSKQSRKAELPESKPSSGSNESGTHQETPPLPQIPPAMRALPAEPAKKETPEETTITARRAFREISVVVKIENGHVVEAFIKNHQPGSEPYESTALRIARRRVYPKNVAGTRTIICSVASEQGGSQQ